MLDQLIGQTGLNFAEFAREARISEDTLRKARNGEPVRQDIAWRICRVINNYTGLNLDPLKAGISIF